MAGILQHVKTYGAFAPASRPVSRNEADPIAVTEDRLSHRDLGVELDDKLQVAFESGVSVSHGSQRFAGATNEGLGTGGPRVTRPVSPGKPFTMVSASLFFGVFDDDAGVGDQFAASSSIELCGLCSFIALR